MLNLVRQKTELSVYALFLEVDKEAEVQNIPTHNPPIQNADYQKGIIYYQKS